MSMNPKLRELVESLTTRSRQGAITWKETGQPDWFALRTETGTVLVGSTYGDGQWPHAIRVLDARGIEVLSFREWWLDYEGSAVDPDDERSSESPESRDTSLTGLYAAAKNGEVRYAKVLDGILRDVAAVPA